MPTPRPTSSRSRASSCCNRGDRSRAACGSAPGSGRTRKSCSDPIRPERRAGIGVCELRLHDVDRRAGPLPVRPGDPGLRDRRAESSITKFPGGPICTLPCWPEHVEVKPGQTVQVTIGGKGRPVIGRIVLDGTPESPVDWTQNEPVTASACGRAAVAWFVPPFASMSTRTADSASTTSRRAVRAGARGQSGRRMPGSPARDT